MASAPAAHPTTEPELQFSQPLDQFLPSTASDGSEILEALRRVKALETLDEADLVWLAEHGTEHVVADGQQVFKGGEIVHHMSILLSGEIHVRRTGGPVMYFIGRSAHLTGKLPFSRMKTYGGDGFAVGRVWTLDFEDICFPAMLAAVPGLGQLCVSTLLDRVREVTRMEQQAEKLNALGKLAANLSHELNNPASAARSAANSLWTELRNYGDKKFQLGALGFSGEQKAAYVTWVGSMRHLVEDNGRVLKAEPMTVAAREDSLLQWMERHGVPEGWRIAPVLAETQVETRDLEGLAAIVDGEALGISLSSFASALHAEHMTDAVIDSTRRIFELITAIKDYSYMDQAPIQEIDIREALDNTLTMLKSRLAGVEVRRDFEADVPSVSAYGGELNQVWTALLENALDAMATCDEGHPSVLTLRLSCSGSTVLVEVCDSGPGIAENIRSRIFEPFFTTKAVGAGLGLGLDTANRLVTKHRGQLQVESSRPGETCIQVRLPIEQTGAY